MLYQAYQAQRDLTAPAVGLAELTAWAIGELPDYLSDHKALRWASATCQIVKEARLTRLSPGVRDRGGRRRRPPDTGQGGGGGDDALRHAHPLRQGVADATAPGPRRRGAGRTLLHAPPLDRPHVADRPRRLPDRLAQRPGRGPRRRPVRPRRLRRPRHAVLANSRIGCAPVCRVPTLPGGARRHRHPERGPRPGDAQEPDADRRSDRLPGEPHLGQPAGNGRPAVVVRGPRHRHRAPALPRGLAGGSTPVSSSSGASPR